uniref:Thoeris anti-defense 2-like domain-containing protein n=1 Tax=Pantoea phage Survivor TaxID=3232176 RepID=A0AAU8KZ86_9CAUD
MTQQLATPGMGYPEALLLKQNRRKVARAGWNGKDIYVQQHGSVAAIDVTLPDGEQAYVEPFFVIVNAKTGTVNTWVPSVSDLNGKDWYEVK